MTWGGVFDRMACPKIVYTSKQFIVKFWEEIAVWQNQFYIQTILYFTIQHIYFSIYLAKTAKPDDE